MLVDTSNAPVSVSGVKSVNATCELLISSRADFQFVGSRRDACVDKRAHREGVSVGREGG